MNNIEFWGNVFAYLIIISLLAKPIIFLFVLIFSAVKSLLSDLPKFFNKVVLPFVKKEKIFFALLFIVIISTPILLLTLGSETHITFLPLSIFLILVLPIYVIKFLICITIRLFRDRHLAPKV